MGRRESVSFRLDYSFNKIKDEDYYPTGKKGALDILLFLMKRVAPQQSGSLSRSQSYRIRKRIFFFQLSHTDSGIQISAGLIMKYSADVIAAAGRIQRRIAEETEMMTAFHVEAVNIEIKGLK